MMKPVHFIVFILLLPIAFSFDHTITCPKAFRLGAEETVVLNLHGYGNGATIDAYLQDIGSIFSEYSMVLNANQTNKPIELKMKVRREDIDDFRIFHRVDFVVNVRGSDNMGNFEKRLQVLVSKETGYLFIITDRPIYRPGDKVQLKVFSLDQAMRRSLTKVEITIKTPDGIGVQTYNGIVRGNNFAVQEHVITPTPEFGLWSAEVKFKVNDSETAAETRFEVQRYVLPTFDVNIEMEKNFILPTDDDVRGVVKAEYSYGEPVQGSLYLSIKVKLTKDTSKDNAIEFFTIPGPDDFTAGIHDGIYEFRANISHHLTTALRNTGEDINSIEAAGGSIFVEATVTEAGSGYLEMTLTPDIPVIVSPYTFDLRRTSLYFTPGLVYVLRVDLLYTVEKRPVNDRIRCQIVVNNKSAIRNTNSRGQINFSTDELDNSNSQTITVRTTGLVPAEVSFDVGPYESPSGRYLQIEVEDDDVLAVGDTLQITFSFNDGGQGEIRYFVIARGSIVFSGINERQPGNSQSVENLDITQTMVPSARIVAYYFHETEIVSNSLWFDVQDQCKTELAIDLNEEIIDPEDGIDMTIRGTPGALVSVSAVDRAAYFLYDGSRLTRDVMFNKMESYDQGCLRNGGQDGSGVFWEAGLTVSSVENIQQQVFNLNCTNPLQLRSKRQASEEVGGNEQENSVQRCIDDGKLTAAVKGENCASRKAHCLEYNARLPNCCDEFEKKCNEEEEKRFRNLLLGLIGRSISNDQILSRGLSVHRSNFQENMLYRNYILRNDGTVHITEPASHSITTFEIDAVSLENNATDGFCIATPQSLRIFRDVFLQVYVPYALKRMEQANIRVAVFNYGDDPLTVAVEVLPAEDEVLCTHFQPGVWSHVSNLTVPSHRSASLPFTVLPLKLGNGETEIRFRVRYPNGATLDGILKKILIEEIGEMKDTTLSTAIDLMNGREQTFDIRFDFPDPFIANSRRCWIYVYSNFMGPTIEVNPLTNAPRDIDSIFRMPYGCGEQNMIVSAPNVYAHMYQEATNQFTDEQRDQSLEWLRQGYERQLSHRSVASGRIGFAYLSRSNPSTWLNAFVDKVFMKANLYHNGLDIEPICSSLRWLLTQQHDSGYFVEEETIWLAKEISSSVGGNISLTAYVAVSLLETRSRCSDELNEEVTAAVTNAVAYLMSNEHSPVMRRNFALSLFTYALAMHEPASEITRRATERLLRSRISENGRTHWRSTEIEVERYLNLSIIYARYNYTANYYRRKAEAKNVEITGYALLALIERERRLNNQEPSASVLEITREIALWLIEQRNDAGVFFSTQDTVIGLQALATYETWIAQVVPRNPTQFSVQFTAPGTQWENPDMPQFPNLTDADSKLRHEIRVPRDVLNQQIVTVTAKGYGEGVVSHRCIYHTIVDESGCDFNISYGVVLRNEERAKRNEENLRITLTVTVAAIGEETGMANIEVGLLSGFLPIQDSLRRLSQEEAVDGIVSRYEVTDVKVVFYLRRITQSPLTLEFDLRQNIQVNRPQPARIYVYDYYKTSIHCTSFYSLPGERQQVLTSGCENSTSSLCKCAEGGCMKCRSREEQLTKTNCLFVPRPGERCETCRGRGCEHMYNIGCKRNYVYEIFVTSISVPGEGNIFYTFDATINEVIRSGNVGVRNGSKVQFVVRRDCFEKCNDDILKPPNKTLNVYSNVLKINATLLVMGRPADIYHDNNGEQKHQFLLDDKAFIERVIPEKKCGAYERVCPSQKKDCAKLLRQMTACRNYNLLKEGLRQGCDV